MRWHVQQLVSSLAPLHNHTSASRSAPLSLHSHRHCILQVEVAVVAQCVTVVHDTAQAPPAALVAALNAARLDASLAAPRQQPQVGKGVGR